LPPLRPRFAAARPPGPSFRVSLFRNGTISGPWHSSYIDTTISGYVIRQVLVGIADDDPDFHPGDQPRLAAFLAALDDEAEYTIKAIEV
jgi:hypothetical protein